MKFYTVLGLLAMLIAHTVAAAPIASATSDGVTVTLYNEPCALAAVVNLPNRATWQEKGKTIEGCFTLVPEVSAVMAYFSDKTVVLMPMQVFSRVQAI